MKHLLFKLQLFLVLLVFTAVSAYAQKSPVDMDRFIDDLMKKMTLEEKIGQLNRRLPVRLRPVRLKVVMWPNVFVPVKWAGFSI